jgi:hypothetical protein
MLIPPNFDARLRKAAQRSRVSRAAWVRNALEQALRLPGGVGTDDDPLARPESLAGPTADIAQMLSEIDAGRLTIPAKSN